MVELDLIPLQGGEFGYSEPVGVGEDNHRGIAVAIAPTLSGGFDDPINLIWGEVFAGASCFVPDPPRRNCPFFDVWHRLSLADKVLKVWERGWGAVPFTAILGTVCPIIFRGGAPEK